LQPVSSVPCPRCGQPAAFDPSNPWRPFCSERCKVVDLGDWASERYRVPAEDQTEPESPEQSPGGKDAG
jgi:endogenous inhibitor of DNA gyrase (YacG/DUF329 family)